jgi:RNA polymerase sigma-70 factor (ECF subfamily)
VNGREGDLTGSEQEEAGVTEETLFLERLRGGDADAGHRFVRAHYPGVYRYLLSLTGHREIAEDLTQQTFLQAWRSLDRFEPRAPLRHWLYRIARRAFLTSRRSRRESALLEEAAERAAPEAASWTETVELHAVISDLPVEEREVVLLHYLEGYTSAEIGEIVRAPAGTVRYRLSLARARLQQALGEGDLVYLNEQAFPMRQWARLPLERMRALEAQLADHPPAPHPEEPTMPSDKLSRRVFLTAAAGAGAAALTAASEAGVAPLNAADVIDARLTRKVTLAIKATALADLCAHLATETGLKIAAGASVADEKVTIFCQKLPLRDVMRQLSRPFGYTWLRSGKQGEYRYELAQDMRSQLLEEELRNRDRNEALLALDREIERYRHYLGLSPDEALARSKTGARGGLSREQPAEKALLEQLAGYGWGPIQIYFRLSNQELLALRAGQTLTFSAAPKSGEQPLAPELARGVFQSYRDWRARQGPRAESFYPTDPAHPGIPGDPPLSSVPELRASITLRMTQAELGEFTLDGDSGVFNPNGFFATRDGKGPYASGRSPAVLKPDNRAANLKLAGDPALCSRVTVQPRSSCHPAAAAVTSGGSISEARVTPADVLEALHRATGLPIVADHYTRLYKTSELSARNLLLFDALNQLCDAMRLRWAKDGIWLQFRSASFYDDRLKEVPNRLLTRWSAARGQHGALALDDLIEIAQLPDAQLDASEMADGARECFGLAEWDLARHPRLRPHLRYLATFAPDQRRQAMSTEGLPFTRMSLAQQQQFLAFAMRSEPLSPQDLQEAALRVDYSQPGGFQWGDPDIAFTPAPWVVIVEPGREGRWLPRPLLRGRTREAVMEAVLRLDPQIRERAVHVLRVRRPSQESGPLPLEAQIFPTELSLNIIYLPAASNRLPLHIVGSRGWDTWQTLF